MKTTSMLAFALLLTSCLATPRRSPASPGGRIVTPMERHDRSVLSPGGVIITPRERRSRVLRGTR